MAEKLPRIFVGVPCYGMVAPELLEDWMRFMFHCGRRLPQYDFHLGIVTKSEQFRARNRIVEGAQQMQADYLLMLDDDMIINAFVDVDQSDAYSLVERLLAHKKDIVGGLYYQRTGSCAPVAMKQADGKGYRFLRDDEITGGLQQVDVAGGGCLLVNMRVFDRIPQPYFSPEFEYGTDIQLCRAAAQKGFDVWLDSSVELGHVADSRTIVTSKNRHQIMMASTQPGEIKRQFIGADIFNRLIEDATRWTGLDGIEGMTRVSQKFMKERSAFVGSDADWYRQYPKERVARQVWFNTQNPNKRMMTEFILGAIDHRRPQRILDFGCGIGIPAYTLAEKGHHVTACDISGTGTYDFLQWRASEAKLPITFTPSVGGVPELGDAEYDSIIAMDCLEHIPNWREVLAALVAHLRPGGVLFCNNAVLDDKTHPEHYDMDTRQFVAACIDVGLMPFNQITYTKAALKPQSQDVSDASITDLVA